VWVCTPDHWHALAAIEAMRRGKDVYVEKPLTLTIQEGRALVNTARKHGRVAQTGSNRRSSKSVHDAVEFIRNEGLGKLAHVDVTIPPNNKFCDATWRPEPVPEGLDWNFWLGPAPWVPFTRQGCHYSFRFILDYAAGQVTNFGAHCLDIAQWGLGMDGSGPTEIEGHGEFPSSGLFTTATRVDLRCRYANGVTLRCRTSHDDNNVRFYGDRGWVNVGPRVLTASNPALLREITAAVGPIRIPQSVNHHDDFLQCMRNRGRPIAEVEIGHRTATVCNLGNIAMQLGRKLRWDPVREEFIGDDVANRMRHRSMRSPWSLV
jgi:predicted dehydrogenase